MESLLERRDRALVGYALLLCGDETTARDLVKSGVVSTFARRWRRARRASERDVRAAIMSAYLEGIRRKHRWAAARQLLRSGDSLLDRVPDTVAPRDKVTAALQALSPRQRACIVLSYFDGLWVGEIAQRVNLPIARTRRHLSDAFARMEEYLGSLDDQVLDSAPVTAHA